MAIDVVGGVYSESCAHPKWNEVYGSAGRAALAIAKMGTAVSLHSYVDGYTLETFKGLAAWSTARVEIKPAMVSEHVSFVYLHDMATPAIYGIPKHQHPQIQFKAEKVVRFGMLEGDAVVHAEWAVYDPQNVREGKPFAANGSTATHLALVLNMDEARYMSALHEKPASYMAEFLAAEHAAEVVIIKMGARGAFVWTESETAQVPAFRTERVWKIGSGDCFVAHFANAWMHQGKPAVEAAGIASLATAYYCNTQALPSPDDLATNSNFETVQLSEEYLKGVRRQVYLAGPFFDLAQIWMVDETRAHLRDMSLDVFSPYHDVGVGAAQDVVNKDLAGIAASDLVLAITDGLDPGTVYEIGYAVALKKPVVVYSERHRGESLKMMEGSGCTIRSEYTTALYTTLWEAARI